MLENSENISTFLLGETAFHSIHSDPRWRPFLGKLGLLESWLGMPSERGQLSLFANNSTAYVKPVILTFCSGRL
jgi:hypothetical protein